MLCIQFFRDRKHRNNYRMILCLSFLKNINQTVELVFQISSGKFYMYMSSAHNKIFTDQWRGIHFRRNHKAHRHLSSNLQLPSANNHPIMHSQTRSVSIGHLIILYSHEIIKLSFLFTLAHYWIQEKLKLIKWWKFCKAYRGRSPLSF